jgi:hypothetical protein
MVTETSIFKTEYTFAELTEMPRGNITHLYRFPLISGN